VTTYRTDLPPNGASYSGFSTTGARDGCTAEDCGTQDTAYLIPELGRRCLEHTPEWMKEADQ
jgi:hypothetical protein